MIVRQLKSAMTTGRRIVSPDGNWESTRLLLKDDAMGFSFHITTIYAGANFEMHYQNHLESVYCISGKGEVTTLDDGKTFPISAGMLYVLDQHDRHMLCASEQMTMACVFNPPLNGTEVHNEQGAYELEADPVSA